jgi:hypothetical protein
MTADAWTEHPDILEIRRYVADIIHREEHTAALTFAELTVGVHADRHPDRVLAEYHRAIIAARGRADRMMTREAIR